MNTAVPDADVLKLLVKLPPPPKVLCPVKVEAVNVVLVATNVAGARLPAAVLLAVVGPAETVAPGGTAVKVVGGKDTPTFKPLTAELPLLSDTEPVTLSVSDWGVLALFNAVTEVV